MSEEQIGMPMAPDLEPEELAVNPDALMTVGEIVRLATQSPDHREYTLDRFENRFLVPAALDQVRVYRTEIEPVAVVTWALVSDELHARMIKERIELGPEDWRTGDNLWIVEAIILPAVDEMVFNDLTQQVFPNKIGHMWIQDENGAWIVDTYYGANRQGSAAAGVH